MLKVINLDNLTCPLAGWLDISQTFGPRNGSFQPLSVVMDF